MIQLCRLSWENYVCTEIYVSACNAFFERSFRLVNSYVLVIVPKIQVSTRRWKREEKNFLTHFPWRNVQSLMWNFEYDILSKTPGQPGLKHPFSYISNIISFLKVSTSCCGSFYIKPLNPWSSKLSNFHGTTCYYIKNRVLFRFPFVV